MSYCQIKLSYDNLVCQKIILHWLISLFSLQIRLKFSSKPNPIENMSSTDSPIPTDFPIATDTDNTDSDTPDEKVLRLFDDIDNDISNNAKAITSRKTRVDTMARLLTLDVPDEFRKIYMPLEEETDELIQAKIDTIDLFSVRLLGREHTIQFAQHLTLEEYLKLLTINSDWRESLLSVQHFPANDSKSKELLQCNFAQVYEDPCRLFTFVTMLYNSLNIDSVLTGTGKTAFLLAAEKGNLQLMRALQAKSCDIFALDYSSNTALHLAIRHKRPLVVAWLLKANFSPNSKNVCGETPLHFTLIEWFKHQGSLVNANILYMLLKADADVNAMNNEGDTPIHLAARHHDSFPLYLILDITGRNPQDVTNLFGETPLHVACRAGFDSTVTMLLNHKYTDVNYKDHFNATALHRAAWTGNHSICEILLTQRHIGVNAVTFSGQSPLFRAALESHPRIVQLLLDNKADINLQDELGQTVTQHVLDTTTNKDTLKILMKHPNLNKKDLNSIEEYFQYKSNTEIHRNPFYATLYKTGTALQQAYARKDEYEKRFPEAQFTLNFEDTDYSDEEEEDLII